MKNAFIIHGAYGTPQQNWFPWLSTELESRGYEVATPQFPTPDNQNLQEWLKVFETLKEKINPETILFGHSIGATFLLSALEELYDQQIPGATCLISGFISDIPDQDLNQMNQSFYQKEFDWDKLSQNTYLIFHSPNDPFVPMDRAEQLAQKLETALITIPNAGHFNTESGYTTFPQLIAELEQQHFIT